MADKYSVQERVDAYRFVVVEDLGNDWQCTGRVYKDVAYFTYRPFADAIAKQLNKYGGVLYLPGTCEGLGIR